MTYTCIDCGAQICRNAKRCRSCAAAHWQNPEYGACPTTNICPDCGVEICKTSKRCRNCAAMAMSQDAEYRRRQSEAMKRAWEQGDYGSEEYRRRQSERKAAAWALDDLRGGPRRREQSKKMKERWTRGVYSNPEWLRVRTGENSPNWRGGAGQDPYPPEFSKSLKHTVRERDGFRCIRCGEPQNGRALDVHHIDADKSNNETDNLVALCSRCHCIVHHRGDFDHWRIIFQQAVARMKCKAVK